MEIQLLLTAVQPIIHHDPSMKTGGNALTFNRRKQIIEQTRETFPVDQLAIDQFCRAHAIPYDVHEAIKHLSFGEFVAVALVATLIDLHTSREGEGLFSGVERYEMLEKRLATNAVQSSTLFALWSGIADGLQLPLHAGKDDQQLLAFFVLPQSAQLRAITAITKQTRSVVALGRLWASQRRLHHAEYAQAAGTFDFVGKELLVAQFNAAALAESATHVVVETPTITGNTIRHQVVRAPSWQHFCRVLNIPAAYPGQGNLPTSVEAIFVNGGNIRAGAKQPTNSYMLAGRIRQHFPSLDLLGGVTDSFDIGESMLKVSPWIVCRENRNALPAAISAMPEAAISVFDMLDEHTEVRHATKSGVGQMIMNFETLAPGTKIFVRCVLDPFVQPLTAGALAAAINEYRDGYAVVAGKSARGYGLMATEIIANDLGDGIYPPGGDGVCPPGGDEVTVYEQYLRDNAEDLTAWLHDGTLGSGVTVCS